MSPDELTAQRLHWLETADIEIEGRMPWSSNATLLCNLCVDGEQVGQAIYKPLAGERPLWDFEPGLHKRECAAYVLSDELGLHLVPPTVLRDGPAGEGSVQWFVDADHQQHYFTIYEHREDLHPRLSEFAFFDFLANNTDRKSGHVLIDADDQLWGIDHGLCFAADFKLRTVIWEFGGSDIPEELVQKAVALAAEVPADLVALLDADEVEAMQHRAEWIVAQRTSPSTPAAAATPGPSSNWLLGGIPARNASRRNLRRKPSRIPPRTTPSTHEGLEGLLGGIPATTASRRNLRRFPSRIPPGTMPVSAGGPRVAGGSGRSRG